MSSSRKSSKKAASTTKSTTHNDGARKAQFVEFLDICASLADCRNADHFLGTGVVDNREILRQAGIKLLVTAMGFEEREWIPYIGGQDDPQLVPQSEDYYPWVIYVVPTATKDLQQFYDNVAKQWLFSDAAGRKQFVCITNLKQLSVFDLNHRHGSFDFDFADLLDDLNSPTRGPGDKRSPQNRWQQFLADFGPASAAEKKKRRRAEVVQYQNPAQSMDRLSFVKRFGHMPDLAHPVGWDGLNFRETFKTKDLPFLTTERMDWDGIATRFDNRLIWGDNLSVMRSMPDQSLDFVYIDPPFFSGRDYNCIFGDDDEVRTFSDIWDGGLPTYLAWLNARLWEIKRLLKPTGSLMLHLDYHAVHYVKVEMDKIFGVENFKNEIIWHYQTYQGQVKSYFPRKHDNILFYSRDAKKAKFKLQYWENCEETINFNRWKDYIVNKNEIHGSNYPASDSRFMAYYKRWVRENGRKPSKDDVILRLTGNVIDSLLDIKAVDPKSIERIGYPTQKPEELLKVLIESCTDEGDVVADFFIGGGTTVATAEKLGRRWIGCDISRIAVGVARDRMASVYEVDHGIQRTQTRPKSGFQIEHHGAYDRAQVRSLHVDSYISFILKCFGAEPRSMGDSIHGFKDHRAISVAPAKVKLSADHVDAFYDNLEAKKIDSGYILAWGASKEAEARIRDLRKGVGGPTIQLIQVDFVDIDSHQFKGDNIRFFNKPAAVIKPRHVSGTTWKFDATASTGTNDVPIHRFQWDFNHKTHFKPSIKDSFSTDRDGDGNPLNDYRVVEYTFPSDGKFKIALKIFDKLGAEATEEIIIENVGKGKAAS